MVEKVIAKSSKLYQLRATQDDIRIQAPSICIGRFLIGRAESCDIIIPHGGVSAVHAILEVTPSVIRLYDMNSKNGTFVNNESVVVKEIKIGDKIKFANFEFAFQKYQTIKEMPPVLPSLDPLSGKSSIQNAKLPITTPEVTPEDDGVPYIVYPLSSDPDSDYSEYIFEDSEDLYPIFKYEINKQAVEVMILFREKVYSVDYLPEKDGSYHIAGLTNKAREIEFPYLGKTEKIPFVEIHKGNCIIKQLHSYKMLHLQDSNVAEAKDGTVNIQNNDIVKLTCDDLEIYVRRVGAPPKVKNAPFFKRDKDLWKYLFMALFLILVPLIGLNFYEVDEKMKDEKDPQRIATILYKQKLVINKNKTVERTKKKPVKKQKAPKKPVVKKSKPKKLKATSKKSNTKVAKKTPNPGSKKAPKIQKVKRVKNPAPKKVSRANTKAASSKRNKVKTAQTRRATAPSKSMGKVDVYKSFDFKSSVNKLLAKGGTLRGAKTARTSSTSLSNTKISGGVATNLKKAAVGTEVGSLAGSTTGKIGESRGTKGLSAKSGVFTAGIPSETVVLGSMDPDVIRRILRDNIPFFRACYQTELDRNAGSSVAGTIRLVFSIGASGHVSRAGVDGKTRLPRKVKGCVVGVLRGIKFPRPMGGGTVDVKQPFNFYPKRL